ncbi:nicotinate-nucleotide--dimethylbenzimidazole phosphoribosyltransferase [Halanaerobium sp. Z-7514]|uniref:Nicotinate-nucleotide--dimethylbenzimidazole phosphoribosyltransferase n=1 Tax=Halanaerobium polyolivorans TaxID=2886943 RepID=A0AAW4X0Z2_9FIRM|nr:nicotinate-nucleotide--dimethylbenzimidazole phosphoribosyltransferase [Halanaerobium polyolivorans]MCC3145472.1 nicotinate-nucleotide--dimethylbenzimidazole phosphoribosyltransferase [Halanaerobium polyolivorans]
MKILEKTLNEINELDQKMMGEAQIRLDQLTKPQGSLGKLEEIAVKLAGIYGELFPELQNKVHIIMAGDHGVAAEGVSAYPQSVTTQMVHNFLANGAAINALAEGSGAKLKIVDIGMIEDIDSELLVKAKIKAGTENMTKGAAMTREEAIKALEVGIEQAKKAVEEGADIISTGEVGIANTTPSSAVLAVFTGLELNKIVGKGTGLNEEGVKNKIDVIQKAIDYNKPDKEDALDVLASVGGLEIAGMAGVMLGAAAMKKAVVIDGLISAAAALTAYKLCPGVVKYLFPSHRSAEPGHIKIYEELNLEPFIDLQMRLGEGTGAVLALPFFDQAVNIIRDMATFEEAGVSKENE